MHTDWFAESAWTEGANIIEMSSEDYLLCSSEVLDDAEGKAEEIEAILDNSLKFDSLPILDITSVSTPMYPLEAGQAYILKHDGRHRVAALLSRGVIRVPVVLTASIDDEAPSGISTLISEDGGYRTSDIIL